MFEYVISAGEGTLVDFGIVWLDQESELMVFGRTVARCGMDVLFSPVESDCHTGLLPCEVE